MYQYNAGTVINTTTCMRAMTHTVSYISASFKDIYRISKGINGVFYKMAITTGQKMVDRL